MAKKRGSYHHGDLRQAILSQALALLSERSGPHFTMREIAARIGVSHSASYRHFKDKDSLLAALAAEGFQRLIEFQDRALGARVPPRKRLHRLGMSYMEFAREFPWHFRVMFGLSLSDGEQYPDLVEIGGKGFQAVVDEVALAQESGDVRPGNPVEIAVLLWATVHGLAVLMIDRQLGFAPELAALDGTRLMEAQIENMLLGLASFPGRGSGR